MTSTQVFEVSADLRFTTEVPGREPLAGRIVASGRRVEIQMEGPLHVAFGCDSAMLRGLASTLAAFGLTVSVLVDDAALLEVGATQVGWWQRMVTRSRHIKVTDKGNMLRMALRGSISRSQSRLSVRELLPALTMLPLAPTFGMDRRPVTTTHDPRRGGNPRLLLVAGEAAARDGVEPVFPLRGRETVIGSGAGCDIRIAGLEEVHAVVLHDERDEFIVEDRSRARSTRVNGAPPESLAALRTGARINVGEAILVYRRAEFADHGRPFGGRVGGEIGHQRSQPDLRRATGSRQASLTLPISLKEHR